jgi:Holliday junction DNA helicase RuvA
VREDTARFQAIPGIGKKTAERIVLELKEKLGAVEPVAPSGDFVARDALVELGWTLVDAERALADVDETLPVEEQVRLALRRAA